MREHASGRVRKQALYFILHRKHGFDKQNGEIRFGTAGRDIAKKQNKACPIRLTDACADDTIICKNRNGDPFAAAADPIALLSENGRRTDDAVYLL